MKNIITLLVFLSCQLTFSQKVENLDQKNGFKEFIFGQNIDDFKPFTENSPNIFDVEPKLLEYKGDKYEDLFGFNWKHLFFAFCDDNLFAIEIDFNYASSYKYNTLLSNLEKLFGESLTLNTLELEKNNFLRYNEWEGKNTYMFIRHVGEEYPRKLRCETCKIQIEIGSKIVEKECLINDF